MSRSLLHGGLCAVIVLLVAGGLRPLAAQPAPGEMLLQQAQAACDKGNFADAVPLLTSLQSQGRQDDVAAQGDCLLVQCYANLRQPETMDTVCQEIFQRWPKTDYAWQAVQTQCWYLAGSDLDKGLARLTAAKDAQILPDKYEITVAKCRLALIMHYRRGQLPDEAKALVRTVSGMDSLTDVLPYIEMARDLYSPLYDMGNDADAMEMHQALRENFQRLGAANCAAAKMEIRFYDNARLVAIQHRDPMKFFDAAKPVIDTITSATNVDEAWLPTHLALWSYPYLMNANRLDDAQTVHTLMQQEITRLNNPYNWLGDDDRAYQLARLGALRNSDPDKYLAAVQEVAARAKLAKNAAELALPLQVAEDAYFPLAMSGLLEENDAIHAAMQDAMVRLGMSDGDLKKEDASYWIARIQVLDTAKPAEFADIVIPLINRVKQAGYDEAARLPMEAACRVYAHLASAGRVQEAIAIHQMMQRELQRIGNPYDWPTKDMTSFVKAGVSATDAAVRAQMVEEGLAEIKQQVQDTGKAPNDIAVALNSLTDVIPAECYSVVMPLVENKSVPTTRDAQQRYQLFAGCAYKAQLYTGRLDEAQTLHQTVQDTLAKHGADKALLDADNTAYDNGLSKDSVKAIFALFQKALAAGDVTTARKWSAILDAFAPEDALAGQARKSLRALEKK